jgi:alpha,alpha-trehalase
MRRYGFYAEADRVSRSFLAMIQAEYQRSGAIEEKYDVVRARADVSRDIRFGYFSNEAGFGWSNAVFTALSDQLAGMKTHNGTVFAGTP